MSSTVNNSSNVWFKYYESSLEQYPDEKLACINVYYSTKQIVFTDINVISLVDAIRKDIVNEKCCVGPEFSVCVENILGYSDEIVDVPIWWFQEAAIRDILEDMGKHPYCFR